MQKANDITYMINEIYLIMNSLLKWFIEIRWQCFLHKTVYIITVGNGIQPFLWVSTLSHAISCYTIKTNPESDRSVQLLWSISWHFNHPLRYGPYHPHLALLIFIANGWKLEDNSTLVLLVCIATFRWQLLSSQSIEDLHKTKKWLVSIYFMLFCRMNNGLRYLMMFILHSPHVNVP